MYKLMIADDEPLIRRGIKQLIDLSSLQIGEIHEASTGEEALKVFEEFKPEIVLMDINMPKIDGLSVAKKIKSINPDTKIAIITGYNYFDYAQTAIKIGVEDYILKPVTKSEIEALLVKVVSKLNEEKRQRELLALASEEDSSSGTQHFEKLILEQLTNPNLALGELAKQLGFSTNYLSLLIKKELGMSFQEYVTQQRIQRAKRLLLSTDMKIYEVALAVGIEDMNYFSYRFKSIVGVSPKSFRSGAKI